MNERAKQESARRLHIKQVRSTIGRHKVQKHTVRALGLRRPGAEVVHTDTPQIRGMIARVAHLVEVTEASA
jgi:large subunit ribosomal protein L30